MTYRLGLRSRLELRGVHPQLCAVVQLAIRETEQDFRVHDGLRTINEQSELVLAGASQTMASQHLRQADGYGHAVDLVPIVNGRLRWEWPPIYRIAAAMHFAATRLGVPLVWGAVWDRSFLDLSVAALPMEVEHYTDRRRRQGKKAFLDGPHYQLGVPA